GCGYCFYACPFGAPQYPRAGNFGSRGKMDKCTYCAGGPEADNSEAEYVKYGRNRLAEGKLPLCAEMCSTKSLLAGDGEIIAQIYREQMHKLQGRITIPDYKAATLEQPQGRTYQFLHERVLPWVAAVFIVLTVLALAAFYFTRGRIMLADSPQTGIKIKRFNLLERLTH